MKIAINEARKSWKRGDYPIGAVITKGSEIIAFGGNRVKTKGDSTKHIELELIQYVVGMHIGPYLPEYTLYSTHEPCPMCTGAAHWARLGRIVYGASIEDMQEHTNENNHYRWRTIPIKCCEIHKNVTPGILRCACRKLLKLEKYEK